MFSDLLPELRAGEGEAEATLLTLIEKYKVYTKFKNIIHWSNLQIFSEF